MISEGKTFIKCVAIILLTLNSTYDLASDNYPEKLLRKQNIEFFFFNFLTLNQKTVLNLQSRDVQNVIWGGVWC